MSDDIIRNKSEIIRRCLDRVREEFGDDPKRLDNFTVEDAIVLNLLRACEASIDLAMHHVAEGAYGVPETSRDAFSLLEQHGLLTPRTAAAMRNMVGFRNIAVHAYQDLQRPILEAILDRHLGDFERLVEELKSC